MRFSGCSNGSLARIRDIRTGSQSQSDFDDFPPVRAKNGDFSPILVNPYPPNHRSNRSVYQDVPARGVQCCPAVTFAFSMVSAVRMKAVRATLLRIPARQHSLLKDSRHRIISAGSQRDHVGSSTHMWCESSPIFLFHMSHSSQVCDIIHIVKILVRRMAKEGVVTSPS